MDFRLPLDEQLIAIEWADYCHCVDECLRQLNGRQMAVDWTTDGRWMGDRWLVGGRQIAVRGGTGNRWVNDKVLLDERQIAVGRKTKDRYLDDGCPFVIRRISAG